MAFFVVQKGGGNMEKIEIRNLTVELQTGDEDLLLEGRVNDLGWSKVLGKRKKFIERIEKGTFTRAIKRAGEVGRPIDLLGDHNGQFLLSSTQNESLVLEEREDGLYMKARISDTDYGRRFYTLAKDGLFGEMSFGFYVNENGDKWERQADSTFKRYVSDIELLECSIVRMGAYDNTQVRLQARGIDVVDDPTIPDEIKEKLSADDIITGVKPELSIEEIIKKAVEVATEKVKSDYSQVIQELNNKIDSLNVAPKEVIVEQVVETPKVDITEYIEKNKQLKQLKGAE